LSSLCLWYASNGLSVNPSKSDAILFSTHQRLLKLQSAGLTSVTVLGSRITLSRTLTLLGITLDSTLSFDTHCSKVLCASLYHLRAIRRLRPILSQPDAELVSCAFLHSRLDYCNSLLAHTSASNIKRLQRFQHSLARVTFGSQHALSGHDLLAKHHWLPLSSRITYEICSITHSVLTNKHPAYLTKLLAPYHQPRQLRSSDSSSLTKPRTHMSLTARSFSVASPSAWNSLPRHLRTLTSHPLFCKNLKTELYRPAFTV